MSERAESPLRAALIEAAKELEVDGWTFGIGGDSITDGSDPHPEFLRIFERHLGPLFTDDWRKHQIAALRAELALLESVR